MERNKPEWLKGHTIEIKDEPFRPRTKDQDTTLEDIPEYLSDDYRKMPGLGIFLFLLLAGSGLFLMWQNLPAMLGSVDNSTQTGTNVEGVSAAVGTLMPSLIWVVAAGAIIGIVGAMMLLPGRF